MRQSSGSLVVLLLSAVILACLSPATASAQCAPAWSSTQVYTGGMTASVGTINYKANWWTLNENPTTHNGGPGSGQPWTSTGSCSGCTTVSAAPTGLVASNITSSGVLLKWNAVTPPAGCTISTYTVFKNGVSSGTATGTTFTVSGLAAATSFQFAVAANDAAGMSPRSSPAITVTTLPSSCTLVPNVPVGLAASGTGSNSTSLNWTAVAPPANCTITGYTVFQNGVSIGAVTTTNRLVTGLTPSTTFTFKVLASDEAGSSAQSSPISVTTLPVNTGGLPKHLLMGYWQDFSGNGAMPLTIAAVPSGYTIIAVAFANSTATPGAVSFTLDPGLSAALGGYTTAQFMADIVAAHAKGQKVIISVGGQNGSITVSDATSATNFANSVHQIMTTFGFDGVDIDLENTVSPTFMGSALRQLVALSPGAIITMAPETLFMQSTGATYFQLALNVKDILTMINTQYYNSGTMLGCDQAVYSQATENFITALACIQFQGGLDPSQVGIGMPATDRATNSPGQGFQPPANINAAVDCLTKGTNCGSFKPPATWPTLRGVMTWDINWDATGGFTFVNTVQPHLAALP